jgi:hypothetical protein
MMPVSSTQFDLLHTCDNVPLLHQLNSAKPTDQSTRRHALRQTFRRGLSPQQQWSTIVVDRDRIVRRDTASNCYEESVSDICSSLANTSCLGRIAHPRLPDMIGTYKNECPRQTIVVMREVPEEVQHYRCDDEGRDQLCTTEKMEWYEGVMSWLDPISRHDVGDVSGSNVRRV